MRCEKQLVFEPVGGPGNGVKGDYKIGEVHVVELYSVAHDVHVTIEADRPNGEVEAPFQHIAWRDLVRTTAGGGEIAP